MRRLLIVIALALCAARAHASCSLNSSMSQSTLQSTLSSCSGTATFAAGTYTLTAGLTTACGLTYTGPTAVPATAILNGSALGTNAIFNFGTSACSTQTLIQYLNFKGADGIGVSTPFANLLVQYNQFTYIPGSSTQQTYALGFFNGTSSNTTAVLSNATITHNQIGDLNSCISPTNVMADTDSPEDYNGYCQGTLYYTSINGLTVTYNNFLHLAEGSHINCPGFTSSVCEPPGGALTQNITVEYNDFNQIHRIGWEEQPQQTGGLVLEWNSMHDWFNPYFGSDGYSMACCYNGTLFQPNLTVEHNVVIFNTATTTGDDIGFGMEAAGAQATYNSNLLQENTFNSGATNAPGMAYSCGPVAAMSYNTVQGRWGGYIVTEGITGCGTDTTPASLTGNVTGPSYSTFASVAPTISPASGTQTFPLTVTLTDPGYTSTSSALPLGNTGIWYTTDGSTPVPGSGTAQYLASGGTFVLASAGTVHAVGMWGAQNQPSSYPAGYGFIPSGVVSATYSGGGTPTAATPALSPTPPVSFSGSQLVSISDSTPSSTIYYTLDGSIPGPCTGVGNVCTPAPQPAGMLSITSYGASPSASAATNTTAIQNCNTAANSGSTSCFIPAGNYVHNAFTWVGPAGLYGAGATSILTGSSATSSEILVNGNNWTFSGWAHAAINSTRDSLNWNIFVNSGDSGFTIDSMTLTGGNAGGIINYNASNGKVTNNNIQNTLADSIYSTYGSNNLIVAHNYIRNSGDDSISNVSYAADGAGKTVHDVLDILNDVGFQSNGRGISVVGGYNITITQNLVQSTTQNACIYLADEPSYDTDPVSNVIVSSNTLNTCSGSSGQPGIFAYAGQDSPGVTNVSITGNTVTNAVNDAAGINPTGGTIINLAFTNNTFTNPGGTGLINQGSAGTNIYCSGNTLNGSATAPSSVCNGTNTFTPTGSTLTYPGNVYTAPFNLINTTTVNALATATGYLNSAVASGTYTNSAPPALSSCSQTNTGSVTALLIGQQVQQVLKCYYASVPTTTTCSPGNDTYGNTVTFWGVSSGDISIGAVGSGSPGLVTAVATGTVNATATATGGVSCSPWTFTITAPPPGVVSISGAPRMSGGASIIP